MKILNCSPLRVRSACGVARVSNAHHTRTEALTWEAMQVDCTQQLEQSRSMLRELSKVLIDHGERRTEDGFHDRWYLRDQERLDESEACQIATPYRGKTPTPRRVMIVVMTFKTSASLAEGTLRL